MSCSIFGFASDFKTEKVVRDSLALSEIKVRSHNTQAISKLHFESSRRQYDNRVKYNDLMMVMSSSNSDGNNNL